MFHALNTKAILRKAAADLGTRYEDCCLIAVHMGGGITVPAHRYGRVIDVNDAMGGDGAFTPDRSRLAGGSARHRDVLFGQLFPGGDDGSWYSAKEGFIPIWAPMI